MNIFHYGTKQANTPWLLCCAAFAIQGSLASFIQHHKARTGIQNLAKKICINASCISRVPEGCWCVQNPVFSAVGQRFPNVQKHNLYHNVQQFEMKEIITLEPYFDWFLQNINGASKHSGEEKKKLHKLSETAHSEFLHLITPICRDSLYGRSHIMLNFMMNGHYDSKWFPLMFHYASQHLKFNYLKKKN